MAISEILNASGILLNLTGSIILAVSLSKYLTALHGSIVFHDLTIKALLDRSANVPVATGVDKLLTKGVKDGRRRTKLGLIVLLLGFVIQLVSFFV